MAQSKPNEMPKIIALLAAIGVVLIFAGYQLFGGSRPAETATSVTNIPAVVQPKGNGSTPNAASSGTSGTTTPNPTIVNAKPGQMRQFDPVLDADPGGTVQSTIGMGRPTAFALYKKEAEKPISAAPRNDTSKTIARNNNPMPPWAVLGGPNRTVIPNSDQTKLHTIVVDNTAQQEITLDGVVTGSDGFAVLTIREPNRQNTAIPDQKRFVRIGEPVADEKIVGITETGLLLSKTRGTWAVGDKRGINRRGMLMAIVPSGSSTSVSAIDSKLPPTQTP